MINLAPVLFENMTVTFMNITKCSKGIPSFSNKKNSNVENDEMTVTFSSTIPLTPSLCKTIVVVPYVDINAKVTNCFPFCTIRISMYQKRILPYFIIPSTFSPQASSPLSHHGRTDKSQHPFHPYFFFLSTERAGPYPQAQLYWAGRTMGWMAD